MKRKISQHVLGLYFGLLLVKNIQEFWALFWATFSHIQEFWALFGLLLMANWAPKFLRTWQHWMQGNESYLTQTPVNINA